MKRTRRHLGRWIAMLAAATVTALTSDAAAQGPPGSDASAEIDPAPGDQQPVVPVPSDVAAESEDETTAEEARQLPRHLPPAVELTVEEFAVPPPLMPPRLEWNPHWGNFSMLEYAITGVAATTALMGAILGPPEVPRRGGILFDEDVRDAVRFDSEIARRGARDMSDLGLSLAVSYPFLVDVLIMTAWLHDSPAAATQMALINVETMAVALAIHGIVSNVTGRERPYVRVCGSELDGRVDDCLGANRHQSFFSGHTMQSFAAAAMTCMHHAYLPLHGGGFADAIPCIGGFALASFTGFMRLAGDQHYLSDVVMGAGIGTLIGLGVPWFFHYRRGAGDDDPNEAQVRLIPNGAGAALVGIF